MKQAHIFFAGRVQGIGFRYTVQRYAVDLGLTGWVKNLADGRVEAVVEGAEDKITQLIESLEIFFQGYIKDKMVDIHDARGEFSDFQITY